MYYLVTWGQCDQKKIAKCLQNLPKNDFNRKIKDFDTFTTIAYECGRFGQINCCKRLKKLVQSPINRPIWSHCHKITNIQVLQFDPCDVTQVQLLTKQFCTQSFSRFQVTSKSFSATFHVLAKSFFCSKKAFSFRLNVCCCLPILTGLH